MSAYVVHQDTINLIAAAAYRTGITIHFTQEVRLAAGVDRWNGRTDIREIATALHAENVYSVNYRYDLTEPADGFQYEHISLDSLACAPLSWQQMVLASIRCLRYQSCEASDYQQSAAARVLDTIEAAVIRSMTEEAPWGWTKSWSAERVAAVKAEINAQQRPANVVPMQARKKGGR